MMTADSDASPVQVADAPSEETEALLAPRKLDLDVEIIDLAPCKKRVKIAIARPEIERQFAETLGEMKREAQVPGFRPGRAPRQLVEKRFRKEVSGQVKNTLLAGAIQQLDADYKLNPIEQPDIDPTAIELPDEGPLRFELELEVRPEFELPEYKGLVVKRPTRAVLDADVDGRLKLIAEGYARVVPKFEGGAEIGDLITADLAFEFKGRVLNESKETQFRLQPELRFQDGTVPKAGEAFVGILPGEARTTDAVIGTSATDPALRGQTIQMTCRVHDLKQYQMPEMNAAFFDKLGFESESELRTLIKASLERQYETAQREAVRAAALDQLLRKVKIDLPPDLVSRQESTVLRRRISELRESGLDDNAIRAREASLRANAHEETTRSLREFFLLAKIAEAEDIKIDDDDFEMEIESIAARTDESPRRVRARLEKEGFQDLLMTQILERKALARVLEFATVENEAMDLSTAEVAVETLDETFAAGSEAEAPAEAATAED